ncbi:formylglycine-generating enzyme family protein [Flavobacterium sp. XS2P12]|uniref:formylglycine-generating enzyme family protein n=1 Tax=Flavobacterium melibiosi TaxID=3398734 RepID=UPI003A86FCCE
MKTNKNVITFLFSLFLFSFCHSQNNTQKKILSMINLEFVTIPSGTFNMGSQYHLYESDENNEKWYRDESPMHRVKITSNFELLSSEVTFAQFELFVKETNYKTSAELNNFGSLGLYNEQDGIWKVDSSLNWKNPGYKFLINDPITHVSWKDAKAFCYWLSQIDSIYDYDLPSEAEWEYAASSGGKYTYSWGNEKPTKNNLENIADNSFITKFPSWKYPVLSDYNDNSILISKVKSYQPNEFGLFDISGNVWEWVNDYYSSYSLEPQVNPCNLEGKLFGEIYKSERDLDRNVQLNKRLKEKVIRGGGFDWELAYVRTTKRRKIPVDKNRIDFASLNYLSAINIGFRIKRFRKGTNETCQDYLYSELKKVLTSVHFENNTEFTQNKNGSVWINQIQRIDKSNNYYCIISGLGGESYQYSYLLYVAMPDYKYGPIGISPIDVFSGNMAMNMNLVKQNGEYILKGKVYETPYNITEREMKLVLDEYILFKLLYY